MLRKVNIFVNSNWCRAASSQLDFDSWFETVWCGIPSSHFQYSQKNPTFMVDHNTIFYTKHFSFRFAYTEGSHQHRHFVTFGNVFNACGSDPFVVKKNWQIKLAQIGPRLLLQALCKRTSGSFHTVCKNVFEIYSICNYARKLLDRPSTHHFLELYANTAHCSECALCFRSIIGGKPPIVEIYNLYVHLAFKSSFRYTSTISNRLVLEYI